MGVAYGNISTLEISSDGRLIAGGRLVVQGIDATIASLNGSEWQAIGSSATVGNVLSLTTMPDGALFAAGTLVAVGDELVSRIARWDGPTWSGVGTGISGPIYGLGSLPSGKFAAGGEFSLSTGAGAQGNRVATWNGSSWSPLALRANGYVNDLAALPTGDLVAVGDFSLIGGLSTRDVARWNGSSWAPMGNWSDWYFTTVVTTAPNGDVIVGGSFGGVGNTPAASIARWNGSAWTAFGAGIDGSVKALAVMPNDDVLAGGSFSTAGGATARNLASWNGSSWAEFAAVGGTLEVAPGTTTPVPTIVADVLRLKNGELIVCGNFTSINSVSVNAIARWNGSSWLAMGTGMNGRVYALLELPDGSIVAGGSFTTADGASANGIARWNGSSWIPFGPGVSGSVFGLALSPTGELGVGGSFATAGGQVSASFARYSFTGAPTMSVQPVPQTATAGRTFTMIATPANGYSGVSVQWLRDGVPIGNGSGGASVGGGTVDGATALLASPTQLSTATLTITKAQPSDGGVYTAIFTNSCGSVTSIPASVTVFCPTDFNTDGFLTFEDFDAFVNAFEAGSASADFNRDGFLTIEDFDAFVSAFEAGC